MFDNIAKISAANHVGLCKRLEISIFYWRYARTVEAAAVMESVRLATWPIGQHKIGG